MTEEEQYGVWQGEGYPCEECRYYQSAWDGEYDLDTWCEHPNGTVTEHGPQWTKGPYLNCPYREVKQ